MNGEYDLDTAIERIKSEIAIKNRSVKPLR